MTPVRRYLPHLFVVTAIAPAVACYSPGGVDEESASSSSESSPTIGPGESTSSDGDVTTGTTGTSGSGETLGESSEADGSSESSESGSTGGVPVACDPLAPFTEIRLLDELVTSADEGSVSLSPDELTIYLFSNVANAGTPNLDAYVATRASIDESFGNPTAIEAINSGAEDRGGWITPDERTFFFYSSRDAVTGYDLWVSSRDSAAAPFGAPEKLGSEVNTVEIEQSPYLTPDGATLYFQREDALYRSTSSGNGFAEPTPVGELNTGTALAPVLSMDGLTIYFASDRPGGAGNLDIWRASRDEPDGVFGDIVNVSELNLDDFAFPEWISADDCRLYFTARRPEGAGGWDIWVAERE